MVGITEIDITMTIMSDSEASNFDRSVELKQVYNIQWPNVGSTDFRFIIQLSKKFRLVNDLSELKQFDKFTIYPQ